MEAKIKSLFLAYLEKNISSDDEKILTDWVRNNPESVKELRDFWQIWNLTVLSNQLDENNLESEWESFIRKTRQKEPVRQETKKTILYWLPRIAAIFLLGAAVSFFVSYQFFHIERKIVFNEISTPSGSTSNIVLPDGSAIWLNAGSSIRYSNDFNRKQREVFLSGEAFFKVASNKSKVFVVNASDLTIKAYGTSFNVKSYPEENTVETTLIEGSVGVKRNSVDKKQDEVILKPNQRVVYYKSSNNNAVEENPDEQQTAELKRDDNASKKMTYMISKGIDPENYTSWKDGVLVINSETLGQLAVKLERKYNVNIHFESESLRNLKFTGSLQNETVEQVIEAIGIAANIQYEIIDRDVWLRGEK